MDVTKPELRCLLAGGAGGSARTRRKRNNPQHESPQSLATALTNVIQQWQPSNQNTPEDHTWGWRKRRKQANNSWQGYRADSSPDTSLARELLQLLQKLCANQASDQEVITATSRLIDTNQGHSRDLGKPVAVREVRYSKPQSGAKASNHGANRWGKQTNPNRGCSHQDITGFVPSEWNAQPKFLSVHEIISQIKAGIALQANISEVYTKEQCANLRTLWHSYGCKGSLTMLLTKDAKDTLGATATRVRISRAHGTPKIEEIALLRLGDTNSGLWILPAVKVDEGKIKTVQRSTVRVIAPLEFRKHFLDSGQDLPRLVAAAMAQWSEKIKASHLMGGKWNHTQVHQQDLLTGWLILPTEQAKELVVNSGRQGVFAQIQENNTGPRPIRWFQRQNNENAETYLQRCLKGQAANYLLRGAPKMWQTEEIEDFLNQQKWKAVQRISKVRYRNEWRFHAQPPSAMQENYHYDLAEGYMSCIPAPVRQHQPTWQQPVRNTWRGNELGKIGNEANNPGDTGDVMATALDQDSSQASQKEAGRERSRSPVRSKQRQAVADDPDLIPTDIAECFKNGWESQDVGGNGDCFYRSIAACQHWQKHHKLITAETAALCGAELRASAVLHAQKHSSRLSSWFAPDSKETPAERGCNPQATNISEWCELQMKQEVWADGLSIQCLAETLGLVIVIFKQSEDRWDRFTFAPGFKQDVAMSRRNGLMMSIRSLACRMLLTGDTTLRRGRHSEPLVQARDTARAKRNTRDRLGPKFKAIASIQAKQAGTGLHVHPGSLGSAGGFPFVCVKCNKKVSYPTDSCCPNNMPSKSRDVSKQGRRAVWKAILAKANKQAAAAKLCTVKEQRAQRAEANRLQRQDRERVSRISSESGQLIHAVLHGGQRDINVLCIYRHHSDADFAILHEAALIVSVLLLDMTGVFTQLMQFGLREGFKPPVPPKFQVMETTPSHRAPSLLHFKNVRQLQDAHRNDALQKWRARMRDLPQACQWLRKEEEFAADVVAFLSAYQDDFPDPLPTPNLPPITGEDTLRAHRRLAEMMDAFEQQGAWPEATCYWKIAALPKKRHGTLPSLGEVRPIAIGSAIYRIWGRIRLGHLAPILAQYLDRNQSGGIGGEDVSSLLLTLDIDLDPTKFPCLMALDFTKAFDSCDYTLALAVMSRLGLPARVVNLLGAQWRRQKRWMSFAGVCARLPIQNCLALPQGDPWSPIAMSLVLMLAKRHQERLVPESRCLLYLDDRTLVAPTPGILAAALNAWNVLHAHTRLRTNSSKTQVLGRNWKGYLALQAANLSPTATAEVLGVTIGIAPRAQSNAELSRAKKCTTIAQRISVLPVSQNFRAGLAALTLASKRVWGLLLNGRTPTKGECKAHTEDYRLAVKGKFLDGIASRHLEKVLLLGHSSDLLYLSCQRLLNALTKWRHHHPGNWSHKPSNVISALNGALSKLDLQCDSWGRWSWSGGWWDSASPPDFAPRMAHCFRQFWRAREVKGWLASDRNDAKLARANNLAISDNLITKLLRAATHLSAHEIGIMSGALKTDAKASSPPMFCHECKKHQCPDTFHVLWQCSHWDHLRRVPPSRCPLVNRLGWGPEGVDLVRVKQCAHIREQLCKVQAGRNYSRPEPFDMGQNNLDPHIARGEGVTALPVV
ncbi:unnamed protein product [Cladocopium goreaui]|uniref:LINE-1 retrotransposable element ORF2 protein n=1 Tax=Cladocopium goreaui TaxID=2562237 RepID=A0A9P1D3W8_9DINO|nr:unnamed protein product [Cladocopium goreaui]